jgi:hypothetical protein
VKHAQGPADDGFDLRAGASCARSFVGVPTLLVGGMHVIECDVPSGSALGRDLIRNAYFHDSYRVPLARDGLGIVDIFFALFGHTPLWMKLLLIVRNAVARLAGLEAPTVAEIMKPEVRQTYRVGEKIGPWPIFLIGDNEIVAGRNNKHMDFRLSVLKATDGDAMSVVVSTICTVHNVFGKIYLFFIIPFHQSGVRSLMSNAVVAKRL